MSPLWILLTILPILGGAERFKCKGRILGAYYADVKSGCKAFHVCVRVAGGGVRDFRFFCPPGTLFHQEAQTCTDWGSDDPLACPNVDGQFDIYKIKSEYESKKLPSFNKGEDESVYGLQRAETGDRRLQQQNNNVNRASPNPVSKASNDLRTAHSQDFFSGRRDDREETVVHPVHAVSRRPKQSQRESYRRATTHLPNATPSFSETTIPNKPDPIPQPAHKPQYETNQHKRINLIRKRPVIASTTSPLKALHKPLYQTNELIQRPNLPPQFKDFEEEYVEVSRVIPKPHSKPQVKPGQPIPESDLLAKQKMPQMPQFLTQNRQVPLKNPQRKPNRYYPSNPTPLPSSHKTPTTTTVRLTPSHPTPVYYSTTIADYSNENGILEVFNYDDQPKRQEHKNDFNYNKQKDFLKHVKQIQFNSNDYNQNQFNQNDFKPYKNEFKENDYSQNQFVDDDFKIVDRKQNNNLQSNVKKNENVPLKVKNAFSVEEIGEDGARTRELNNFNNNYNKGTTDSEVNKINAYNTFKQSITSNNSRVTIPTPSENVATVPTKSKINSVAVTTNNGFLFDGNLGQDEDDGQYHPPSDEDDGQYRPEHYDTELLSGAHSINIAASGNKLLEDKKSNTKIHSELKKKSPSPRPFRVQSQASGNEETESPYSSLPTQTPRSFDVYKTYTTTSRPSDFPDPVPVVKHRPTSPPATVASTAAFTAAPRTFETRPPQTQSHAPTFPPNPPSRPTTRNPISKPVNKTEDTSYDYAYYDSDSGFPEYEQLADFGTKTIQK